MPMPKSGTTQASSSNQCGPNQSAFLRTGQRNSSTAASHLLESAHGTSANALMANSTPHGPMTAFRLSGQQSAEQHQRLAAHERIGMSTQHSVPSGKLKMARETQQQSSVFQPLSPTNILNDRPHLAVPSQSILSSGFYRVSPLTKHNLLSPSGPHYADPNPSCHPYKGPSVSSYLNSRDTLANSTHPFQQMQLRIQKKCLGSPTLASYGSGTAGQKFKELNLHGGSSGQEAGCSGKQTGCEDASNTLFNTLIEKTANERNLDEVRAAHYANFAHRSLEQNSICNRSQHSSGPQVGENQLPGDVLSNASRSLMLSPPYEERAPVLAKLE